MAADYTGRDRRFQYLFQNGGGGGSCKVISGYYHNGSFYEDQSYTQIITGDMGCLYIDLDATTLYLFDGTDYEEVQGGGGGSTVTITPTLATGTKIADYSIDGVSDSLYAPTGGGANALDDLTDVTITAPSDGQALLYDSATGEWVNGTVPGGGGGSDGTAGLSIDISLGAGQSITYSRTDLNITRKGCYLFSITSGHNAWMEYLGYFFYGGHYPGYTVSGIFSIRSSYLTVSYSDGQNGTFTIKNTSSYAEGQRIEILPIHPKLDVDTNVVSGYYHNGEFYEDQSYTQIITGDTECLYIDLDTTTLYLFDGTDYVEVQGGGGTCGGLAVTEEVLQATEVTLTAWANPLSIPLTLADYVGFGVEITWQSGSSPVSYFVTEEQIDGNTYVLIPSRNSSHTHNDLYIGYSNGTLNFYVVTNQSVTIHRVTGLKKANIHTYSTTEQVVGTWIDGSAIYETTYDLGQDESVSSTAWFSTGITIADIERVVNAHSSNSGGTFYPLMVSCSNSNISIEACRDNNPIAVRYLTIQYTKTTD